MDAGPRSHSAKSGRFSLGGERKFNVWEPTSTKHKSNLLWVSVGQYFIFGALCPSKSGLMNKHIVKHIVKSVVVSVS